MNYLMTRLFIEQPLASPGSVNYKGNIIHYPSNAQAEYTYNSNSSVLFLTWPRSEGSAMAIRVPSGLLLLLDLWW